MLEWPRFNDHALNCSGVLQISLPSLTRVFRKLCGVYGGSPDTTNADLMMSAIAFALLWVSRDNPSAKKPLSVDLLNFIFGNRASDPLKGSSLTLS
jgi:hypothetical protein